MKIKCDSCGILYQINSNNNNNYNDNKEISNKSPRLAKPQLIFNFCNICNKDKNNIPEFKTLLFSLALGYFMKTEKVQNDIDALLMSFNHLSKQKYWKNYEIPRLQELKEEYLNYKSFLNLFHKANSLSSTSLDSPDFFISHCWTGPDEQFTEKIVEYLKFRGYIVWYDKDMWENASGRLEEFLQSAILSSDNFLIFLCKDYFESKNCNFEVTEIEKTVNHSKKSCFILNSGIISPDLYNNNIIYQRISKKSIDIALYPTIPTLKEIVENLENTINTQNELKTWKSVNIVKSEWKALKDIISLFKEDLPLLSNISDNSFGVYITNNHICRLNLTKKSLGTNSSMIISIPHSFARFQKLQILHANLDKFPKLLCYISELKELYLTSGEIKSLPKEIKELINLTHLSLANNKIDIIPYEIGSLYELEYLNFNSNQISEIPPHIGDLNKLIHCEFYDNLLSALPQSFSNLISLKKLFLWKNKFSSIPHILYTLKNLEQLIISYNNITRIPHNISTFEQLQSLDISNNKLNDISKEIGDLVKLKELNLGQNELKHIPESIGKLLNLNILYLRTNKLSNIPESIGNLKNLIFLSIADNLITQIPINFINLQNLTSIAFGGNISLQLSDSIKNWITQLENNNCKVYN